MADQCEALSHWLTVSEILGFAYIGANVCSGILHSCSIVAIAFHTKVGKLNSYHPNCPKMQYQKP